MVLWQGQAVFDPLLPSKRSFFAKINFLWGGFCTWNLSKVICWQRDMTLNLFITKTDLSKVARQLLKLKICRYQNVPRNKCKILMISFWNNDLKHLLWQTLDYNSFIRTAKCIYLSLTTYKMKQLGSGKALYQPQRLWKRKLFNASRRQPCHAFEVSLYWKCFFLLSSV